MRNKLLAIGFIIFAGMAFGQYIMKSSYIGSGGPVQSSAGGYELWGSASAQTAVTITGDPNYEISQGFYHPSTMFNVVFRAADVQRAAAGRSDSISVWEMDSLYVVVHYLSRGVWRAGIIGNVHDSISAWVDTVQASEENYWYELTANFETFLPCPAGDPCDPAWHRWQRRPDAYVGGYAPYSAPRGAIARGDQSDPTIITVGYYDQHKCQITVQYIPPTGLPGAYLGGKVANVSYVQFADTIDSVAFYEHGDVIIQWVDAGNTAYDGRIELSENTTSDPPFYTVDARIFRRLDKAVVKTIRYKQTVNAILAQGVLWQTYRLFGVPVYPFEDTTRYKNFSASHGCSAPGALDGNVGYGEQDIVLYDDMHSTCASTDSNCGRWSGIPGYRISRYNNTYGGVLLYQGPTGYSDASLKPPRFRPGLGYWGSQNQCDSVFIDAWGVPPDSLDSFEVGICRHDGTAAVKTQMNMLANPFFDETPDDILVDIRQWKIRNHTLGATADIATAVTNNWIQPAIYTWRRIGTAWTYQHLRIIPTGAGDTARHIEEWEGFWFMEHQACTDSLSVLMYTEAGAGGRLLRSAVSGGWSVNLACETDAQADAINEAGFSSSAYADVLEMGREFYPPDIQSPMRMFFVEDGKELAASFYSEEGNSYYWQVRLESGNEYRKQIRIYWNLDFLPDDFAAILKVPGYGEIDMRQHAQVYVNNILKPLDMELYIYPRVMAFGNTSSQLPDKFFIATPTPNPFNLSTTISFGVPADEAANTTVEIYDLSGRLVKTLWNKHTTPGYHNIVWNGTDESGKDVTAGTYFCVMKHPSFTGVKRAIVIK